MDIKGLVAPVVDGKVQNSSASSKSLASASEKDKSQINSDAFLTLLVAEMQNQDPLEPTSNTEWISQYATFTQVSEVQAIGDNMNAMKADGLTGKTVIMSVMDETGNTDEVSGIVDYVTYEEGKAYLSIDGSLYSINDLKTVVSDRYVDASDRADELIEAIKKLPAPSLMTKDYFNAASAVVAEYDDMDDFEKGFLDESFADGIEQYRKALQKIVADEQAKQEKEAAAQAAAEKIAPVQGNVPVQENAYENAAEAVTPVSEAEAKSDSNDESTVASDTAGIAEESISDVTSDTSDKTVISEDESASEVAAAETAVSAADEAAESTAASETEVPSETDVVTETAASETASQTAQPENTEAETESTEASEADITVSESSPSGDEEAESASDTGDEANP